MNERRRILLTEAAKEFARLSCPFDGTWLAEHAVTLDECGDLSDDVARAIRLYLRTPDVDRTASAFRDALAEAGIPPDITDASVAHYKLARLTDELKKGKRDGSEGGG